MVAEGFAARGLNRQVGPRLCQQRVLEDDDATDGVNALLMQFGDEFGQVFFQYEFLRTDFRGQRHRGFVLTSAVSVLISMTKVLIGVPLTRSSAELRNFRLLMP